MIPASCPQGQRLVVGRSTGGHHGGAHCEPDPRASRCSVGLVGVSGRGGAAWALAAVATALAARRRGQARSSSAASPA